MESTVTLDKKGRLVIPKKVRERAKIKTGSRLVARAKGEGQIELLNPELILKRAQEIGSKKLKGWREEDHEASDLLIKLVKGNRDENS